MNEARHLPLDLSVQCGCGQCVPLILFVIDGRPHNQHPCPACGRVIFLGGPVYVATHKVA